MLDKSDRNSSSTLGQRLIATNNRPTGFDYLRVTLSLSVVFWHSFLVVYGRSLDDVSLTPARPFVAIILPMFFSLSGFLVAGSLDRCKTLISFLSLRAIRIFPALAVEVFLSACIVGPSVTTLAWKDYFADPAFRSYFLNVLGKIHFALPGCFLTNPLPIYVNLQLWTIPYELKCYIAIALLALLGARRFPALIVLALMLLAAKDMVASYNFIPPPGYVAPPPVSGIQTVIAFLSGILVYRLKERLPYSLRIAAGVLLVVLLALYFCRPLDSLSCILIAYVTACAGLTNIRKPKFLGADYSYGVFLYGFVVQQCVVHFVPWADNWFLNFALTALFVFPIAALSWHFVEKPMLTLRTMIYRGEALMITLRTALIQRGMALAALLRK